MSEISNIDSWSRTECIDFLSGRNCWSIEEILKFSDKQLNELCKKIKDKS